MKLTIKTEGLRTSIDLGGRLDTVNALKFEQQVLPLVDEEKFELVINCDELVYISSAGLRQLLLLQKASNAKEGKMVIRNLQPEVKEIFDMTGFSSVFTIE